MSTSHDILDRNPKQIFENTQPEDLFPELPGKGTQIEINKNKLQIDGRYQRRQKKSLVSHIAQNWNWQKFGSLIVSERKDKSYWVVDGGHRATASFYRTDILNLPCVVYRFKNLAEEAKIFSEINQRREAVKAQDIYRSDNFAQEAPAVATEKILTECGYNIRKNSKGKGSFAAIGTLHRITKENPELAHKTFKACSQIAEGRHFPAEILNGLFYLAKKQHSNGVDIFESNYWISNLIKTGVTGCRQAIQEKKKLFYRTGPNICARALMDIMNKRKRNKLTWV